MAVNRVQRADGTVELDVTGVTAAAADVTAGKKFVGADGVLRDGSMQPPDYNFIFTLSDGTTLTSEEVHAMNIPQGEVVQIQNGNGEILWEHTPSLNDPVLDNNSWETIAASASAGIADTLWSVGDCKAVTVNGTVGAQSISGTYYVYILGFAHNGATGTIDFGTFKTAATGGTDICLVDGYYNSNGSTNKCFNINHNSAASNYGGWKGCDLRHDILGSTNTDGGNATTTTATSPVSGTLMAALPSDLRAVMKPMSVYTDNYGLSQGSIDVSGNVTVSIDYLPLLAEYEIFGTRSYANSAEQNYQKQYDYYSAGNSKVKYQHNATGNNAHWWERSPCFNSNIAFCCTNRSGIASYYSTLNSIGLSPIFRV